MPSTLRLSGRLADISSHAVETVTEVTMKAQGPRPGPGIDITTSEPVPIDVDARGFFTVDVVEGLGWIYATGPGWSEVIPFVAAQGMTTMWEAVANASVREVRVRSLLNALNEAYESSEAGTILPPRLSEAYLDATYAPITLSESAQIAVSLAEAAQAEAEQAAQQAVSAASGSTGGQSWVREAVATGTDLNSLTVSGVYTVHNFSVASSLDNKPADPNGVERGTIRVYNSMSPSNPTIFQQWSTTPAAGDEAVVSQRWRDTSGSWSPWRRVLTSQDIDSGAVLPASHVWRPALGPGDDLDTKDAPGFYGVQTLGIAQQLVNGPTHPPLARERGTLEVLSNFGPGNEVTQRYTTMPGATRRSMLLERHRDSTGAWSQWEVIAGPGSSPSTSALAESTHARDTGLLGLIPGRPYSVGRYIAPVGEVLDLPTHEGSGMATHPTVRYFPSGWGQGGFKYWMAVTPYPYAEEGHEDPNILCSQNGVDWEVPAGLTNPLDDQSGAPSMHNSDTDLAIGPDGSTLYCSWRSVDRPDGNRNRFFWRTSTNGVNWTPKKEFYRSSVGATEVSQSLVWVDDQWRMYHVSEGELRYHYTAVADPGVDDWYGPVTCAVVPDLAAGRSFWHSDVRQVSDTEWWALIQTSATGSTLEGDLHLLRSRDGEVWELSPVPLVPRLGPVHDSLYRSSFVPRGDASARWFDVFYSGFHLGVSDFRVLRTRADAVPPPYNPQAYTPNYAAIY